MRISTAAGGTGASQPAGMPGPAQPPLLTALSGVRSSTDTSGTTPGSASRADGATQAGSIREPAGAAYTASRTPVWFMRQAGRSLPEYRALRAAAGLPMLEACLVPELAAEITLQPVRRHGVDAAVFFSDIMIPLRLAGVGVRIEPGVGPVMDAPVRTAEDVARLTDHAYGEGEHSAGVRAVADGVRAVVAELGTPATAHPTQPSSDLPALASSETRPSGSASGTSDQRRPGHPLPELPLPGQPASGGPAPGPATAQASLTDQAATASSARASQPAPQRTAPTGRPLTDRELAGLAHSRGEAGWTPVIGFGGAPFTLAAYLVEGRPSRDHLAARTLMHADPPTWDRLMRWCAEVTGAFIATQIEAGAAAAQLFDSWAGSLSPADYRERVQPYSALALERARTAVSPTTGARVPLIHFGTGTARILADMRAAGADAVGVDDRTDLTWAIAQLSGACPVQGNIDPALLAAPWPVLREAVDACLEAGRAAPGHVVNLGHGVPPATDPAVLTRVVARVHGCAEGEGWDAVAQAAWDGPANAAEARL